LTYPGCRVLCARIVRDVVGYEAPETVAAIIVDPICAPIGFTVPPDEYFAILRQLCDEFNILLIFDEVITGFGRTGEMFAAHTFKTTPDIICMAKGMASGYAPISAIAVSDRIAAAFLSPEDGQGFMHGATYGGNPVSCAAAIACISENLERDLSRHSREMGEYLRQRLQALESLGIVGEIRGKGLQTAVELVKNPQTKQPFPKETQIGLQIGLTALKKGLLTRYRYDWIEFTPPLIITEQEIDQMVDILFASAEEVLSRLNQ
jgi:adenosylmethionine-8-amino-7-oxononanoate aminotransferase